MPSKPLKRPLKPQQEAFARSFFLNGGNATQAALDAGYKEKAAYSQGSKLSKHPQVKDFLEKLKAEADKKAVKKFTVSKERIVKELARMAFADPQDYAELRVAKMKNNRGKTVSVEQIDFKASADWKPGQGRAIKKLAMGKHGVVMEFHDKKGALELLSKLGGHVEDTVKHKGDPSAPLGDSVQVLITMPDNGRDKK